MKTILFIMLSVITMIPMRICSQVSHMAFYTVNENILGISKRCSGSENGTAEQTLDETLSDDSTKIRENPFAGLPIENLERMLAEYEEREQKYESKSGLCFYEGDCHELNMNNLTLVVGEIGLSNQLFVLAQAILETGNFSSNVCKNYNNLFGLYDSRNKDYYKFQRWEDSVVGYKKFIQYKYKGGNYLAFLKRIGYAEDPSYIRKVAKIARNLYHRLFDK